MTKPISSFDSEQIQTRETGVSQNQPEMTQEVFGARVFGMLNEGYQYNHDAGYVTGRLYQLASENPATAGQVGFPMDYIRIKAEVVEPYNDSQKLLEKGESGPVSFVKKGWDKYYDWAMEKDECIRKNAGIILDEGIEFAGAAAAGLSGKVPMAVGIVTSVKEGFDVFEPFVGCHINPQAGIDRAEGGKRK